VRAGAGRRRAEGEEGRRWSAGMRRRRDRISAKSACVEVCAGSSGAAGLRAGWDGRADLHAGSSGTAGGMRQARGLVRETGQSCGAAELRGDGAELRIRARVGQACRGMDTRGGALWARRGVGWGLEMWGWGRSLGLGETEEKRTTPAGGESGGRHPGAARGGGAGPRLHGRERSVTSMVYPNRVKGKLALR
jgi:hypothetical protein